MNINYENLTNYSWVFFFNDMKQLNENAVSWEFKEFLVSALGDEINMNTA